jgi:hypothetical protein
MVLKIFAKIFLQVQDIVICSTQGAMFLSITRGRSWYLLHMRSQSSRKSIDHPTWCTMLPGLLTSKFEKDFEMKAQVDKSFSWVMNCIGFPKFTIARSSSSVNVPTNLVCSAGSCRGQAINHTLLWIVFLFCFWVCKLRVKGVRYMSYKTSATRGNVSSSVAIHAKL